MFVPNNNASNYMKQQLIALPSENKSTIILGGCIISLPVISRPNRQKITKNVEKYYEST